MSDSYASKRYRANLIDPYARAVERNLRYLVAKKTGKEMRADLKKYGKSYGKGSYNLAIARSTLDVRSFLKFMLASGVTNFTISVTEEEISKINEYEEQRGSESYF